MTEREEVARGEQARRLIEEPLLQEILASIEEETVRNWKASKDPEFRENCHKMFWTVAIFRDKLRIIADNGQLVASMLERRQEREQHNG